MITLDPRSATPPYEQLRVQIAAQVESGELAAGSKLPTVRRLADDLGIAPNTVARAYRELESDGFVETRGRNGTLVRAQGSAALQQVQEAARAYADRAAKLGVSADVALGYVARALGS
ncbi:GntR family transcriptional regulator [Frondihabitans australicus]|uniref:GntR family transcriptional regulator n=1 Tax=Frondihabitans australicus TaxID=386892 RepID=A0A495IHA4_9MICO|nr:GntR family transcriptional regulator [Frondihabitans australicus]RKR75382.1 GntR family transcriptional regulator [Frondihabitans australicus]